MSLPLSRQGLVTLQRHPIEAEGNAETAPSSLVCGRQEAAACSAPSAELALAQHASRDLYVRKGPLKPSSHPAAG